MHHLVIGEFVFSVGDKTPIMKMNRVTTGRFTETSLVDGAMSSPTGKPLLLRPNGYAKPQKVTSSDYERWSMSHNKSATVEG